MLTRKATAIWEGGLRGGRGNLKCESGAINVSYSYASRFETGIGSNPEELLAAAAAACFTMALSGSLEKAGTPPTRLESHAACTIDRLGDSYKVSTLKLVIRGTVPNVDAVAFQRFAQEAKESCPLSVALRSSVRIELDCKLI